MRQNLGIADFKLEDWWPMEPQKGPPLPSFLGIFWPWYKLPPPPPPPPGLANLYGKVTDAETGSPIIGMVGIFAGRIITTDSDGAYSLTELTPGSYTIKFDVDGYETLIDDIAIVEGNNQLNVELVPLPGPPEFPGFSLLLANYPPGTAYWLADFPYMGYPEKITMRPIGEPGWITAEAPGTDTIRIVLMDEDYQCIDPSCQRNYTFLFENGRHYLLDLAADELGNNPDPPPLPPEYTAEPAVISADIPVVASGAEFWPELVVFLPLLDEASQYWAFYAQAEGIPYADPGAGTAIVSGAFIAPALVDEARKWGLTWIPLDKPDGKYTLSGICTSEGCSPARATYSYVVAGMMLSEPLPPGRYPVKAYARSYRAVKTAQGIGLYQVGSYDLGDIGILEVT